MAMFVLDCSVSLCWCFADEATPETTELLMRLEEHGVVVPSLWHLETANALSLALRKKRIDTQGVTRFLALIARLPIDVDDQTVLHALNNTLMLSQKFEITAYDAAYLELAQRLDIPLASKDALLCRVAHKLKVRLVDGVC